MGLVIPGVFLVAQALFVVVGGWDCSPAARTIFEWHEGVHQNPGFAARRDENLLVASACGRNVVPSQHTGR